MTRDELLDLISDVTTLLGTALAQHVELTETIAGAGLESQRLKLDSMKAKLADERLKLAKLKDAAKRQKDIAADNQRRARRPVANEGKSSGTVYLRDGKNRVIGFMRMLGKGRTDYFTASSKLVARVRDGKTFMASGAYAGNLDQGLRVLGQSLRR